MEGRRRKQKSTRFVYSEGAQDNTLMLHLRSLYATDTISVDPKRGNGGSQPQLVAEAARKGVGYGAAFVLLDGDRDETEMQHANDLANEAGVQVVRSVPSMERVLIEILEPGKKIASWSSVKLKKYFQDTYIPESKRTTLRAYAAVFPKDVLDEARGRVPELDEIIGIF